MTARRRHLFVLVALTTVCAAPAHAASAQPYEADVSDNAHYGGAEPAIAVNPTNPANILEEYQGWTVITKQPPDPQDPRVNDTCWMAVSNDRGATWQRSVLPVTDTIKNSCGDPVVVAGSDGTFYAGGDCFSGQSGTQVGEVCVSSSNDGGRTWSSPVAVLPAPETFVTCVAQLQLCGLPGFASPYDRPFWAVDASTGAVFVSAIGHDDPDGGTNTGVRYVAVSHDKAHSFGSPRPVDSPDYPGGGNGTLSAANGVLAVAYISSAAPARTCPCLIFETSSDAGLTFDRHVVPVANPVSNQSLGSAWVAADPSRPGHFAVLAQEASGTALDVYVTRDSGATWAGPAILGESPPNTRTRPWLGYSPTGTLGAFWKTQYPDNSFDAWAAVASDGGPTFGSPISLSSTRLGPEPTFDDTSNLVLDRDYLHAAWGDARSGVVNAWYARVPLPSVRPAQAGRRTSRGAGARTRAPASARRPRPRA